MRTLIAMIATLAAACCAACSSSDHNDRDGALTVRLGTHAAVWTTR